MDEWDAMGHGMKIDRRSADWGFLSLVIGGSFLIMSPIMLTFNMLYWVQGVRHHTREELDIARVATLIIGAAFLALIVFGLVAAFRSMALARSSSHPTALPLGGILICGLDIVLWIGLYLHLLAVLGVFN